jgi:hypothetical protein
MEWANIPADARVFWKPPERITGNNQQWVVWLPGDLMYGFTCSLRRMGAAHDNYPLTRVFRNLVGDHNLGYIEVVNPKRSVIVIGQLEAQEP